MRKLWNRPALPVWSLVTKDDEHGANLNICTYVTSVSMEPKLMLLAVYKGTRTLENLKSNRTVLLQLLAEEQASVVRVAGQQSGLKMDKWSRLKKRFAVAGLAGLPYLSDSLGVMQLEVIYEHEVGGDHVLFTAKVVKVKNLREGNILTTDYLKQNGYTR